MSAPADALPALSSAAMSSRKQTGLTPHDARGHARMVYFCDKTVTQRLAVRINGAVPTLLDGSFDKHRRSVPSPSADGALPAQRSDRPVASPIESSGVPR